MVIRLHTFLFVDICAYSRLTELDGDEAAADLAIQFASTVSAAAREHGAQVVKWAGDGVMVHGENAAAVVELGVRLARLSERGVLPTIHAGIHTGVAVERASDWWGATVNIAARVAAAAETGQLVITQATKDAAGELGATELSSLGPRVLRNIADPVRLYLVGRRDHPPLPIEESRRAARDIRSRPILPWIPDHDSVPASTLAFEG